MSYVNEAGSKSTARTTSMFARLLAVLVVFIMVSTAFVAVLSRAEGTAEIWTSKDEYSPGETVEIYGGGFVKWVPVTITISHPDLIEKSFVVTPDLYGRFVCTDYSAEIVKDFSTPVTVTATQVLDTGNSVATTKFYDPAAYIEGWTLMPHQRWTTGDVKGYSEGDSIPMIVVINKKQLHGSNVVTMSIGVDMFNKTPSGAYGIDYLTQYWLNPPAAPFNTYANSSQPFFVAASEGTLSDVFRDANIYDEGRKLTEQVWTFTFTFATGSTSATIRFGAHLAVTDLDQDIKGASYWPGESLHVRIVAMSPDVNNGNRDVPMSLRELTGPPEMELIKECDPEVVLEGDTITFTVHWMNTGEAPANCVRLWDELPWSVDLISGTFLYWDSSNMVPMAPTPGPQVTSTGWQWDIGFVPGATGGVPFEAWLSFQAVVITSEPGWYENWVYLSYTDSHGSDFPDLSAVCRFYIPEPPSITIVKSGPVYAHDGDLITYTYNVTNTGPVNLTNVDVVDDVVGVIASDLSLAAGSWTILTATYVVQASDPHNLVNVVTVTGEDQYGREVSDDDTWTVIILRPHVEVDKEVSISCAKAGETIWYTISWLNPPEWETTLYNVTLDDSLLGEFSIGTLLPGQGDEMVLPYEVTNDWDPLVNTVQIQGEDLIHGEASASDSVSVDVVHPLVQITKTSDKVCGLPGESITYTITVTNPLAADVWLNGTYGDTVLGQSWSFSDLKPGENVSQKIQTTLPDIDPFENGAWVVAFDHQYHMVEATDSVVVDVVHPDVEITKTVDLKCGLPGETVVFTITVTNPGTADVWLNGTIFDPLLEIEQKFENLKPGESIVLEVPYILPAGTEIFNVAWVEAYDHQQHLVTDRSAEVRVDIVNPEVQISKRASAACAAVGELITWTIIVWNPYTADVWLNGTVTDDVLGMTWDFFNLRPGDARTFELLQTMPDGPTEIVNVASVSATDHQGHVVKATSDAVRVDIVHPDVEIEKTSSLPCAAVGEEITWTITVTNPASADVWLNGTVTDPILQQIWSFFDLMPGESKSFEYTQAMPDGPTEIVNVAYVEAFDHQQHIVRNASEPVRVDIVHPGVVVEKSASLPCAAVGEEVTWTITVINPGSADVWLNGTVSDPMLGQSWDFTNLVPGDSVSFEYTQAMPDGPTEIVNIASVTAKDHQGHIVTDDSNVVRVDIVHPAVDITKTADKVCAAVGEDVTFTITVTNPITADVWLNGTVSDPTLDKVWSFFDLMPGDSFVRTVTIPMPLGPTELINTASVTAYDHQKHLVTNSSSVRVDIVHPAIEITKTSSLPCAAVGEEITWNITVTNPASADVWLNGTVWDPILDEVWFFSNLMPGESKSFEVTLAMPQGPTEIVNVAYVEAFDHQQHLVRAASEPVRVDIVHPEVEISKVADRYLAHDGDVITYVITVTNPVWADVMLNGSVEDSMFGSVGSFTNLAPGASAVFILELTVLPETPEVVLNTAVVTAKDHQGHEVSANDSWLVTILRPSIDVTKIGPIWANVGDVITYYVNVTNTGNCDLFNVSVFDTLAGELGPIAVLLKGETVHLTYQWTVPPGEGTLDNTVTAKGEDRLHLWVQDEASWTVQKLGVVEGMKAADYNANGIWDLAEPGLMNWLIVLEGTDEDGPVYRTTLTDSFGQYKFTGLKAGEYTVSETLLPGWHNFSPLTYSLSLGSGTLAIRDFLNMPYGNITGHKWMDLNLNGVWDDNEPAVQGWNITLAGTTIGGLPVLVTVPTDAEGVYSFFDLMPGFYIVSEESRTGWYATTPTMLIIDAGSLDPFEVVGQDFGNVPLGEITGFKWLDENMNGYEDGVEPKLPGWTIILDGVLNNGTTVHKETVTGPTGYYAFSGLLPGVYTVREVLQDGWKNITPLSREITIIPGSNVTCAKFGNVPLGCIEGWKFLDWDMDGTKDGNEPGIPGWQMTLTGTLDDIAGTPVGPIVIYTVADGVWKFCNLLPGTYTVTEEARENWFNTTPLSLTFELTPWHIELVDGHWDIVIGGTHVVDVKFGNVPYTCLWGHKWNDLNGDGQHQENEPGIANWTIRIVGVRNDGVPVDITLVTNESGIWKTCFNILPGTYRIFEVLQNGWAPTSPEAIDVTIPMNMEPARYQYDFMNFQNGKIKGYKYEDMNGDGLLDGGDVAIQNWVIRLENAAHVTIATVLTASDGSFEFTGLSFGTYYVVEESLGGWVAMTPTMVQVDVSSGTEVVLDAFLNVELSTVFGYKFNDLNGNGVWDDGEPGIPGWTIYMLWDADPLVHTATTDANGKYEFTDLMPDGYYLIYEEQRAGWTATNATWEQFAVISGTTYRVHDFMNFENVEINIFKFNDLLGDGQYDPLNDNGLSWMFTVTDPDGINTTVTTDLTGHASIVVSKAGTYIVTEMAVEGWCPTTPTIQTVVVTSGMAVPGVVMFGNFKCVDIVLFKYNDVNGDGVYDPAVDEPLEGWTFNVWNMTDDTTSQFVTDADGKIYLHYCTGQRNVLVWEVIPEGWTPVSPIDGSVEILILSGIAINHDTEVEQYLYEFGNFQCVQLTFFKFWDKCSNGWYDPDFGDQPLEGWYIALYDASGALVAHGYTDQYGYVNFTICIAGQYTVVEEDRVGWSHIVPASGSYTFEVISGDKLRFEFANYQHVKVPVFKYEDVNSNGVYDPQVDRPIEGWHFDLIRSDGYTFSGATGPDGMFVFEVNRSGIYTVKEEDRAGWTHVNPVDGMRLVNIISGFVIPVQEFGNFHNVCIPVFKFADADGDGHFEPLDGDAPVQGWNFTLWVLVGDAWVEVMTKATNASGTLCFPVNSSGTYKVTEESREGWIWIVPGSGEYTVRVQSGTTFEIPLTFANFKFGKITGHKYNDLNGNGVWDEGEPGLPGWTIHIMVQGPFFLLGQVDTDANGSYEFTGLPPGIYSVWEDGKVNWTPTSPSQVTVEIRGNTNATVDFFNFHRGCVEGYKYEDVNDNGVYDPGVDKPLQGWTIELDITTGVIHTPDGDISAIAIYGTTETDENGHYQFCGLGPGLYIVREETKPDWVPTSPASSGIMLLHSGEKISFSFLNFDPGMISGFKFEDKNSNGVWDVGEPAVEGWTVYMIEDSSSIVQVAHTNASGFWIFDDLRADYYLLWEESREGWTNTTQGWFNITIQSGMDVRVPDFGNFHNVCIPIFKYEDVNGDRQYEVGTDRPIEGWEFNVTGPAFPDGKLVYTDADGFVCVEVNKAGRYTITESDVDGWMHTTEPTLIVDVVSGIKLKLAMFGNFERVSLTGLKFYDQNLNGIRDQSEPGLANWVIVLVGPTSDSIQTRLTDSTGAYSFEGLGPGAYMVYEDLHLAPAGWVPTLPPVVNLVITSGDNRIVDFGNAVFGNITGVKFYDKDMDGIWDDGEPGLAGWTIKLDGVTDYGVEVHKHRMTDANGHYAFEGLQPGKYNVTEVMPGSEWVATTPLPQTRDSSGAMEEFSFVVNIGNVRFAKICGYKFLDTYAKDYPFWPNGVFDADEVGLGNWKITLQGWTDTGVRVDEVRYTDNVHMFHIGWYCFDKVLPGMYWVNETMMYGFYATRPISNLVMVYPFPLGPVSIRIDFGNMVPSKDPQVPFVLEKGWNLWSSPLIVNGLTAKSLLAAIGPSATLVTKLNPLTGSYEYCGQDWPARYDFPIVLGQGYFIFVKEKTAFSLKGDLPSTSSIPVQKGWNIIGYNSLEGTTASKLVVSGIGCHVKVVTYLDTETGGYKYFAKGFPSSYDFQVTSGRAYFVYIDAAGTLSL